MNRLRGAIGKWLAVYLSQELEINGAAPPSNPLHLQATLRPGDVLLVEGNTRLSGAIKYLTQSTWSHAALYVGINFSPDAPQDHCLIDADTVHGVRSIGLDRFVNLHTRICRPIKLSAQECAEVAQAAIDKIGQQYDLRNMFDLARYLFPTPPVPTRFRRQLLSLGSGDPTRAICSTLIAQAFESIHYPIIALKPKTSGTLENSDEFLAHQFQPQQFKPKHHSLLTPRDFDVSPYFAIIKPTVECGFDFHNLEWVE